MEEIEQNQNNYDISDDDNELQDEEDQNALVLASEQELYASQVEAQQLYNQGQEFRHPSYLKYSALFTLALIVDIVDLIDLSGYGAIIGRIISFVFSAFIILIFWFTNTRQKSADDYVKNLENNIEIITERIANAEKNIVRVARLSRHIPGARQAYRALHLKTIRLGRVKLRQALKSTKNPLIRSVGAGAVNLIPFLAVVPWQLIGIWLSYRAERESYKNAREASTMILKSVS